MNAAETTARFTFDSLEFLKWSTSADNTNPENRLPDKSCIRNIPGCQVGHPLFDRMVSLYAYYSKQPPSFVGATRSPGFEWLIEPHRTPEYRERDDIQLWSISVLFGNCGDIDAWVDTIWRTQIDHAEQIIFEHACAQSVCRHFTEDAMPHIAINSLWWHLAHADFKSELASTCGCKDHDHAACEAEEM
jgi:hypothetical protein